MHGRKVQAPAIPSLETADIVTYSGQLDCVVSQTTVNLHDPSVTLFSLYPFFLLRDEAAALRA